MKNNNIYYLLLKHLNDNSELSNAFNMGPYANMLMPNLIHRQNVWKDLKDGKFIEEVNVDNLVCFKITMKGVEFVMNYEKFIDDAHESRRKRQLFWYILALGIVIPGLTNLFGLLFDKHKECIVVVKYDKDNLKKIQEQKTTSKELLPYSKIHKLHEIQTIDTTKP